MAKFKVGKASGLRPGEGREVALLGRKYAVFNIDGKFYGLDGACKHMKASLAHGRCDGPVITCYMHNWQYDVTTGACLTQDWAALRTYPVEIIDDDIFIDIDMGDPDEV